MNIIKATTVLKGCALVLGLAAFAAGSAWADDLTSARDIQSAVDSYLATSENDTALVGGPGSAGYDDGFWIRGGDYLLRINATLQARFEAWDWDDEDDAGRGLNVFAGDTSGFSLPRATLKFSGEAPCNICYFLELEFGHHGENVNQASDVSRVEISQSNNFDHAREAWIEWCNCDAFNFRMGTIQLPSTRQLMVDPEKQQFVDISLASSWQGNLMPGYTDRNHDHGFMVHGAFGCDNEWQYMIAVTNGDGGDSIRNVLDHNTSDNLAFGGRLNWAFLKPIGYTEGALGFDTCNWFGEIGAWAHYYADRNDKPHVVVADRLNWGVDLALGYGGFSFTGAYNVQDHSDLSGGGTDFEAFSWLAQLGYHFPGTAFEIAARASAYDWELGAAAGDVSEFAFGVNYYINGHSNKLQLDASFLEATDAAVGIVDRYAGYQTSLGNENSAILIRFQWQLAL